jgi:hypothetical protein
MDGWVVRRGCGGAVTPFLRLTLSPLSLSTPPSLPCSPLCHSLLSPAASIALCHTLLIVLLVLPHNPPPPPLAPPPPPPASPIFPLCFAGKRRTRAVPTKLRVPTKLTVQLPRGSASSVSTSSPLNDHDTNDPRGEDREDDSGESPALSPTTALHRRASLLSAGSVLSRKPTSYGGAAGQLGSWNPFK